jgi:DNA-binding transcriptional ArsR family regulator
MVQQDVALDNLFHALADPTRRAMLASLAIAQRNIGELAAPHAMSFAAASKHVRVLEQAGLVRRRIEGRSHILNLEPRAMKTAERWITQRRAMWERHFDQLADYLAATDPDTEISAKGGSQ